MASRSREREREAEAEAEREIIRKAIHQDAETIMANMEYKEREIWQKRLYLMGLSDTHSLENPRPRKPDYMPESFLRKDDVFYEEVKEIVEKGFGMDHDYTQQHTNHEFVEFRNVRHMSRVILGLLDDFTNIGLYSLAKVLAEDSITFEKTRTQMEKVIRKSLEDLQSKQCLRDRAEIQSQVSELLGNKKNFRNNVKHLNVTLKSHRDAIMKVLDGLGDMPTPTLSAMYRKLRSVRGYMPQLCPPRSGWNRDRLIDRVKTLCLEMIGQLGDSNELPEPLAKAMAVACLSAKLASGYQDVSVTRFTHFTPEQEAVQNDICKAIQLIGERIKKEKIKKVQHILDPESTVDSKGVKSAIKNMLIEFLYECSDMDTIPDSLLDALSVINETSSHRVFSKDLIEAEVEGILNLSAAIKQILLDHIPGEKLDEDFEDAYMEDLVESDDGDFFDDDEEEEEEELLTDRMQGVQIRLNDFNEEVQSTGDADEANFSSSQSDSSSSSCGVAGRFGDDECMDTETSGNKLLLSSSFGEGLSPLETPTLDSNYIERQDAAKNKSVDLVNCAANSRSTDSSLKRNPMSEDHKKRRNRYVAIQEVCDQASLAAYRLTGHLMEELAKAEDLDLNLNWDDISYLRGGSSRPEHSKDPVVDSKGKGVNAAESKDVSDAVIRAILKVSPSFPSSELEKIKNFMSS